MGIENVVIKVSIGVVRIKWPRRYLMASQQQYCALSMPSKIKRVSGICNPVQKWARPLDTPGKMLARLNKADRTATIRTLLPTYYRPRVRLNNRRWSLARWITDEGIITVRNSFTRPEKQGSSTILVSLNSAPSLVGYRHRDRIRGNGVKTALFISLSVDQLVKAGSLTG